MIEGMSIYRVCKIQGVWNVGREGDYLGFDAVEVRARGEIISISRQGKDEVLTFDLDEWQAINNFIKEELEADAETDS